MLTWQYPWPRDGESVSISVHILHDPNIFLSSHVNCIEKQLVLMQCCLDKSLSCLSMRLFIWHNTTNQWLKITYLIPMILINSYISVASIRYLVCLQLQQLLRQKNQRHEKNQTHENCHCPEGVEQCLWNQYIDWVFNFLLLNT